MNRNMEIQDAIRNTVMADGKKAIAFAFLLFVSETNGNIRLDETLKLISESNEDIGMYLKENCGSDDLAFDTLLDKFDSSALRDYILSPAADESYRTPDGIVELAEKILEIRATDIIIDLCSGTGSFVLNAAAKKGNASCFGCELNFGSFAISYMRNWVAGGNVTLLMGNVFDLPKHGLKADKIFSNFPFGLRGSSIFGDYLDHKRKQIPRLGKGSSDWAFASLIIDLLSHHGKAVALMTLGSGVELSSTEVRRYFIDHGYVEAIISLPANLLMETAMPVAMVVFSMGNTKVRMIDAAKEYRKDRRKNCLEAANISTIFDNYENGGKLCKDVSIEDINAANYNLSPAVYLNEIPDVPYGRPFEDVMISVQRGANITAKMLDGLVSAEPTAYRYMQISDIHEGKVDNNLQYLKTLDDKLEKYCVQDKDLIISKIASPGSTVKVAVANVPDDEKIVAAGNLYVIRVDQNIIDPYYLKAYLESATGTLFLKRAATGMTIPSISVSNLKKILVPVPPIEEQTKVVDEYMSICDEIELLRRRMDQAYERLHNVFDANIEDVK